MKKDYIQPIIEIEYYEDVILCQTSVNEQSNDNYGEGDVWGGEDLEGAT